MPTPKSINNAIYDELGERWYGAQDDPIALLRAEAELRNPWIECLVRENLARQAGGAADTAPRLLDIGCGGGFLSNRLSASGLSVDAVDLSEDSLRIARAKDASGLVRYQRADAGKLPFDAGIFDAACAMDFLEHVDDPGAVVAEAARVLKPGGLFFFYTFNRNPLSWLIAIKGVEWFVRNTPPDLHLYRHFIRPAELGRMCGRAGLDVETWRGARPVVGSLAFWRMLATGVVPKDFRFRWTGSLVMAYAGVARKRS